MWQTIAMKESKNENSEHSNGATQDTRWYFKSRHGHEMSWYMVLFYQQMHAQISYKLYRQSMEMDHGEVNRIVKQHPTMHKLIDQLCEIDFIALLY